MIDLHWPRDADEELRNAVHRVLHDVVADGGAVGYTDPPSRAQTDAWLDDVLADVQTGDGAIVVARVDGIVQAMGTWRRERPPVFRTSAEVAKVMAHRPHAASAWAGGSCPHWSTTPGTPGSSCSR